MSLKWTSTRSAPARGWPQLWTLHQEGQVFAQQIIPVRTSLLSPSLRKWIVDNDASDSWLHRCSCRKEKQVRSLQKFITLKEKILCHTHQRTQELRVDPLSRHEEIHLEEEVREGQSTVNQLTVQKKDLQEHPEAASRSSSFHVPSQPLTFPSCDSSPLLSTLFWRPSHPRWTDSNFKKKKCAQEVRQRRRGCPMSPSTMRPVARIEEPKRETQNETTPNPTNVGTLPTLHLLSYTEEGSPSSSSRSIIFRSCSSNNSYAVDIPVLDEFQDRSVFWFQSSFRSNALDWGGRDGHFGGRSEDVAINSWTSIPKLRGIWREDRFLPEEDLPKLANQKRVHLEEKAQKDDRFLRCRQIAYMIYEHLGVTGTHEAFLDFSDLSNLSLRGDDVRGFDTRWDEILLSVRQVPSDEILESLCKMWVRESDQLKTVLALYEQDIEQNNSQPSFQRFRKWEPENLRPETKETWREHWRNAEAKGNQLALKGNKETAFTGKLRESARQETRAVSATMRPNGKIYTLFLSFSKNRRRTTMGKILRMESRPKATAPLDKDFEDSAKITFCWNCTNASCDFWHPLPCAWIANLNRAANSVKIFRFCTWRLIVRRRNDRRRVMENCSAAILKNAEQLGGVIQDVEPPKFVAILRKAQNSWDPNVVGS